MKRHEISPNAYNKATQKLEKPVDDQGIELRGDWPEIREHYISGMKPAELKARYKVTIGQLKKKIKVCGWEGERLNYLATREREREAMEGGSLVSGAAKKAIEAKKAVVELNRRTAHNKHKIEPSPAVSAERIARLAEDLMSHDHTVSAVALNRLVYEKAVEAISIADSIKVPKTWNELRTCLDIARQAIGLEQKSGGNQTLINVNLLSNSELSGPKPATTKQGNQATVIETQ